MLQTQKNVGYEEMLLGSPASKKMKSSLIFKMDVVEAQTLKVRVSTMLSFRNLTPDVVKPGTVPHPRDGHSAVLYENKMIIFGGDRNKFPYNDLFIFSI